MENKHTSRGVIFIHSALPAVQQHVEWAVSAVLGYEAHFEWTEQPIDPRFTRGELSYVGEVGIAAKLASALRGWDDVRFEITEEPTAISDGGRYLSTPSLGIFYAQTDLLGNIVVPENRIRAAIEEAGSDMKKLSFLLDVALGAAWDRELEPFRYAGAGAPVRCLHQVG